MNIIPNTIKLVTPNGDSISLIFMGAIKGESGESVAIQNIINELMLDQDFIDFLSNLITNTVTETDYILQLGMLRYLIPIMSIPGEVVQVDKTYESALVLCTSSDGVEVSFRVTDELEPFPTLDFSTGAFVSFRQTTVGGQVTLVPPEGTEFNVPVGFLPKTRALNSIITATCEIGAGNTWTLSGDLALDPSISVGQTVTALTSAAGVCTIDCSLGDFFTLTPTENISSIVLLNPPPIGYAQRIHIQFTQHAASAKTVAYPDSFKGPGGVLDAVSSGLSAVDQLDLTTYDSGVTWLATIDKAFA